MQADIRTVEPTLANIENVIQWREGEKIGGGGRRRKKREERNRERGGEEDGKRFSHLKR